LLGCGSAAGVEATGSIIRAMSVRIAVLVGMATVVLAAAAASAAAALVLRLSAREPAATPVPTASAIATRPTPAVSREETASSGGRTQAIW
jgi:hypothetical protein